MGHYDSCRDADEALHFENKARRHRKLIEERSDEELGRYLDANEYLQRLSAKMLGTCEQHDELNRYRRTVNEFHQKREKPNDQPS